MCSWPTGRTRNRKRRPAALPQASFVCLKVLRPFAVFDVELSPAQGDVQSGGPGGRGAGGPGGVPHQASMRKTDRSTPPGRRPPTGRRRRRTGRGGRARPAATSPGYRASRWPPGGTGEGRPTGRGACPCGCGGRGCAGAAGRQRGRSARRRPRTPTGPGPGRPPPAGAPRRSLQKGGQFPMRSRS